MYDCVFCNHIINTIVCYNGTCTSKDCDNCYKRTLPSHMYCATKNGLVVKYDNKSKTYKYHIKTGENDKVNFGYDFSSDEDL